METKPYLPFILDEFGTMVNKLEMQSAIYIGSLGFEDRCIGVLKFLAGFRQSLLIYILPHSATSDTRGHRERSERQQINRQRLLQGTSTHKINFVDCMVGNPQTAINEIASVLKGHDEFKYILFDFSTMPTSILFPLFRKLWETESRNIIALYSVPSEYTSDPLFYEVSEPYLLSGFHEPFLIKDFPNTWIPILGFQSESVRAIMEWGGFDKVFPIIAFPGYRASYVDRVLYANAEILRASQIERIYYSSANNPVRTYQLIDKLVSILKDNNIILSPLGPKPQSLGLCLAAIVHNLQVVYAQPWAYNPNYSIGYQMTFAYWLRKTNHAS